MTKVWEILGDLEPYILQLLLAAIALFSLSKDWDDYVKKLGKFKTLLLFVATIAVIFLTLLDTHSTRRETREKEQLAVKKDAASTRQIEVLTDQISLERDENKHNSDGFRHSFDALYQKYSDLASKTQNAGLLRELAETQKQLKITEAKLVPPKAKLDVTFWHQDIRNDEVTHEVRLPKRIDGSVAIDLMIFNNGDTPALNGSVIVRICMLCKYAKEPVGFARLEGAEEQDRSLNFQHLLPHTADEKHTIEVIPPPFGSRFQVDVTFACENCVTNTVSLFVTFQ